MKKEKLSGLDCVTVKSDSGASDQAIVLFHGYGANCLDLADISKVVSLKNTDWYFPDGLHNVPISPFQTGKSWFNLNLQNFDECIRSGNLDKLYDARPQGLDQTVAKVNEFYLSLRKKYKKIVIGGFSQGAMLSTEIMLNQPSHTRPDSLAILSGLLIDQVRWRKKITELEGFKIFQSHGTSDTILPYAGGVELCHALSDKADVHFVEFNGGHEIPLQTLEKFKQFLQKQIGLS